MSQIRAFSVAIREILIREWNGPSRIRIQNEETLVTSMLSSRRELAIAAGVSAESILAEAVRLAPFLFQPIPPTLLAIALSVQEEEEDAAAPARRARSMEEEGEEKEDRFNDIPLKPNTPPAPLIIRRPRSHSPLYPG